MSDEQEIPQSIPDAEPLPAAPAPSEAPAPAPSEAPLHWTTLSTLRKTKIFRTTASFAKILTTTLMASNSATTAAATFSTE